MRTLRFLSVLLAWIVCTVISARSEILVSIAGPGGSASQALPDAGGQFDFNLPLKKNSLNKLTITAKDALGQTVEKQINVTQLSFENLAVASLKAEPLPPARVQELVNSGVIKLDDPANFNVSQFTIVLTIGTRPVPIQVPIAMPKAEVPEASGEAPPPAQPDGQGNSNVPDVPPQIIVFEVQPAVPGEEKPRIPGVLVIEGRIKTLKEFFSAKFLLMNTSGIFTLSDVTAKLEFPDDGLSATLPADGVAALGEIPPGAGDVPGQALKEFIFRGDEKGVKRIRVSFGGKVTGGGIPEDSEIPFNGAAETSVEVKGPPSFAVKLTHPDFVNFNVPYDFGVEITNTGDTPALYTSLDLDVGADGTLIDCTLENGSPACKETEGAVTRNFGHIYPGQTVKETFLINPKATGPITSCMGISDQNIDLSVTVGNIGCVTGKVSPPAGVPTGVPTVTALPFSNALGISPNSPVVLLFSEKMNRSTIRTGQGGTVNVYDRGGAIVPGELRFDVLNGRDIAIWQVNDGILNRFQENSEYSIEVKAEITDLQGVKLFSGWGSKFTTSGEGLNDFTPPTIALAIDAPVNPNNVLPGQRVRVNAFASDQGSAVQKVELRVDDLSLDGVDFKLLDQKNVLTGDKPPFFFLIDSRNLIPGHTYQFRGTAYDFAGNSQDAFLSMVVADSAPPPTVLFATDSLEVLKGVPLQITPAQVTGGAYEVSYFLDGTPLGTVGVSPFAVSLSTLGLTIGTHSLQAIARDGLNQTGSGTKNFIILPNSNAPQVTFVAPNEDQLVIPNSVLSVKALIEDPVGLQSVQWYFDDPNGAPFATGVTQFTINTAGIPIGTYKLFVKATNNLGLANDINAPQSSRTIRIDNPPPAPPPSAPSVNATAPTAGFVTVTGTTEPNRRVDIKNATTNLTVTVYSDASGHFSGQIEAEPADQIQVVAYDPEAKLAGGIATVSVGAISPVTTLLASPDQMSFTQFNATADIKATATRQDGSVEEVTSKATYTSSNQAVASVNSTGRVVALGNGSATITVSFGGKSAPVNVSVSVRTLDSLAVTPQTLSFGAIGQTSQLTVTGNYSDTTTSNLTSAATYSTGNPAVAVASANGLVTALGSGSTTITVSRPGIVPVSVPVSVTITDSDAPVAHIDSPDIGTQFERGKVISVAVSASDAGTGVKKFSLSATGGFTFSESRVVPASAVATQTFDVVVPNTVSLPNTVTFALKAEDAAGNSSPVVSRTYALVDATAPTVTIQSPAPGTPFHSGDTIAVQVTANDSVGVTQIRYSVEGSFTGSGQQVFSATPGAQNATFNIVVPFGLSDPELTLVAFGKDGAGNEGASAPVTVNITSADTTPPATVATSISSPTGSGVTITYEVTDGLSDLKAVNLYFRRNGIGTFNRYTNAAAGNPSGNYVPQSGNTGTIVFDGTRMGGDGSYEFYTVGVDVAGNREPAPLIGSTVTADQTTAFSTGASLTVISANTTISAADTSFDDKNLRITGPITVTIDGSHAFRNIEIVNGAKVVHSETTVSAAYGLDLSAWTVSVDAASSIDVSGRGYVGGATAGNAGNAGRTEGNVSGAVNGSGGSYGGPGGVYDGTTNPLYGNFTDPLDLGSGGGARGGWFGGDGGGRIRIASINIAADGNILANGTGGQGNASGDGSGGSINFAVATLSGTGLVAANGGESQSGGGGGRIGVTYLDITTKDQSKIRALGGVGGYRSGGNGTVFLRDISQTNGNLVFDGQPGVNTFTALPIPPGFVFDNITIRNNARVIIDQVLEVTDAVRVEGGSIISHTSGSPAGLKIRAKRIVVDATSAVDADGKGYVGGCVAGNLSDATRGDTLGAVDGATSGCGGSYGGESSCYDGTRNPLYGDPKDPQSLGSGGGCRGGWSGGNGGGFIDLDATDSIDITGIVRANGSGGQGNASGDGSGGTVRIRTGVLKGTGSITANGGGSQSGGGGGRIHVKYAFIPAGASGFNDTLNIKALGGRGGYGEGAPGTVVLKRTDQPDGDLFVDDGRNANAVRETELTPIGYGKVVAVTASSLTLDGAYPQVAGGLVGLMFRPNINSAEVYRIVSNTGTEVTVDTTAKPALTSVTHVGGTYSGVFSFDNVFTRRGGSLRLSDRLVVANKILIGDAGRLTHREVYIVPGTATPIVPRIDLLASSVEVSGNSSINVSGRGYPGGYSTDAAGTTTRGYTSGFTEGALGGQGGSFGGLGGNVSSSPAVSVDALYGSVTDPEDFGAGGGSRSNWFGGDGGGWIAIRASSIRVDGLIAADGTGAQGNASGDGAGGTVNIRTVELTGTGTIRANGGASQSGGAGGRIAIRYGSTFGMSPSQLQVLGGAGGYATGGNGTLFLKGENQTGGDLRIEGSGGNTPFDRAVLPSGESLDNVIVTNNARVLLTSPLAVTQSFKLTDNSVVTHAVGDETGVQITAPTMLVDATSAIDVTGRGYRGGLNSGNLGQAGETLGKQPGALGGVAGSYGGLGGVYSGEAGQVYGSPHEPLYLGGGGGSRSNWFGGNGGGRISLTVSGTFTLEGALRANGAGAQGNAAGDGAGGSILIDAGVIAGSTGSVAANGGASQSGGGGGRVYIRYGTIASGDFSNLRAITAFGGRGGYAAGAPGTVLLHDRSNSHGDLIIDDNVALTRSGAEASLTPLGPGTITALTDGSFTVDGGVVLLPGALAGLRVNPNVNQQKTFLITGNSASTVTVDTSNGGLTAVAAVGSTYALDYRFNTLEVRGKATLSLFDPVVVSGSTIVGEGAMLTHPELSSPLYTPRLDVVTNGFFLAAGAQVNVDGRGYLGGCRPGNSSSRGLAPSFVLGSQPGAGGSYGGLGASFNGAIANPVYGNPLNPLELGSGGGCRSNWDGGDGGGMVRIVGNVATIDGTISARGAGAQGNASGDGSGGSVNLTFSSIAGSGSLTVAGGASQTGGGGGRLYVSAAQNSFTAAQYSAAGGAGGYGTGSPGSVVVP